MKLLLKPLLYFGLLGLLAGCANTRPLHPGDLDTRVIAHQADIQKLSG